MIVSLADRHHDVLILGKRKVAFLKYMLTLDINIYIFSTRIPTTSIDNQHDSPVVIGSDQSSVNEEQSSASVVRCFTV